MGLLRLLGLTKKRCETKYPPEDVDPCSAEDMKAALLGLNALDVPWVVRDGTPEGADLIAEWQNAEPVVHNLVGSGRSQLRRTFAIRMRLYPEEYQVRAIEDQREATWHGASLEASTEYRWSRGPVRNISKEWTVERGSDGRRRLRETFHFDTADMKGPVLSTVLKSGWTWCSLAAKEF
ncbi:hypothetical protein [Streptomyces cacaoi]|uniref:hypothetical protein n=1 Tax=Streptomyces cacaoi TaxID=1898 RepID=UPI0033214793